MARMRRDGLAMATPTQDEVSAELTDARKNEPTTIIGGTVSCSSREAPAQSPGSSSTWLN
jgi:hypothetical protein